MLLLMLLCEETLPLKGLCKQVRIHSNNNNNALLQPTHTHTHTYNRNKKQYTQQPNETNRLNNNFLHIQSSCHEYIYPQQQQQQQQQQQPTNNTTSTPTSTPSTPSKHRLPTTNKKQKKL